MTERLSCLFLAPLLMVRRSTWPCLVLGALLGVMGCGNGENNGTSPDPEATSLQFSIQPADVAAGTGFSVEVRVVDAAGQIVATATATIQLTLEGGAGGAGLSGVVGLNAVAGRATFSNLAIEVAASGYALRAASGALTAATSSSFTVLPSTPAELAFDVQPSDVQGNEIFGPVVAVSIVDQFGNVVTTASDPVTLTVNGTDAELLGTGTVAASQGIAVFTDLRVDRPGSGFTLSAQAGALVAATSSTFDVRLVFLSVHPGGSQVCGLTAPGHAYCWGNNGSPGGLGIGIFGGSRDSPVLVVGGLLFEGPGR